MCTSNFESVLFKRPYSVPQVEVFYLASTLPLLENFSVAVDAGIDIIEDGGEW